MADRLRSSACATLVAAIFLPAIALAEALSGPARVIDGDTIDIAGQRVRIFGIDAPEGGQQCRKGNTCYPCGLPAKKRMIRLVVGKTMHCEPTGAVTYGRVVAVCKAGGADVAEVLLRDGLAVAYRRYLDDVPERKLVYLEAEREAQDARRGLWAGEFVLPERWRRDERLLGCE